MLAALALVTAVAALFIPRIEFDNSIEAWFLEQDPSLAIYDRFTATFRADQIVVIGLFAEDLFAPDVLSVIDAVSQAAHDLEFAERVQSITNSGLAGQIRGFAAPDFRERILASPLHRAALLSEHADATAIIVYYAREGNTFAKKRQFVESLRAILDAATAQTQIDYAMTGAPVLSEAGEKRNSADMRLLVPAMIVVILGIAFVVLRRLSLTLLPLAVVGLAVIWTYAVMGAAGWSMTMLSIILVPLVLAVGLGHSMHIITGYRLDRERGQGHEQAVKGSLARHLKPCFYTCITTVVGLLSLLVSALEPVHEFALTAAVGVFAAFLASVTFLPLMLLLAGAERPGRTPLADGVIVHLLEVFCVAGQRYRNQILLFALLTGGAFFWLARGVESGLDSMSWIPPDDPVRIDTARIDAALGGALSLEFLVTAGEGGITNPAMLRRLAAFEDWLLGNTQIARATSIADLVKEAMRLARESESAEDYVLPRSRVVTDALLDPLERGGELAPWLNENGSIARIAARVPLSSAQDIVNELPMIKARIERDFEGSGATVELTGHAVLAGHMQTHLLRSQSTSFAVALAVISVLMVLLLRSPLLAVVAMIPNLLPILIGLGGMTLFGIALNPATVMIAAVALGIVVDDTVHLMTGFERELRRGRVLADAIRTTLLEIGKPVLVTSLLLAAGFSVMLFGSFLPTRQIGGLIALIAVAAVLTDLVFLPAVLRWLPASSAAKLFGKDRRS